MSQPIERQEPIEITTRATFWHLFVGFSSYSANQGIFLLVFKLLSQSRSKAPHAQLFERLFVGLQIPVGQLRTNNRMYNIFTSFCWFSKEIGAIFQASSCTALNGWAIFLRSLSTVPFIVVKS